MTVPLPIYRRIAEDIRRAIRAGTYGPGVRLPSRAQLAERYDCSMTTVDAAIILLSEGGWVIGRGGMGTFVAERPPR